LCLEIIALICAGLTILVVLAAVKLSMGPLSVGFIAPYIVNALEPEDGSFQVSLDDAVLTWRGWQRSLQVRALGVKISDPSGDVRAEIPELTIGFSARALLDAQIAPTSLEVVGPRLTLARTEDGAIRFADEPAPAAESPPAAGESPPAADADSETRPRLAGDFVNQVFSDLLAPPGPSNKLGYLTSLSILDADLTLEDRNLNITWRAPSATLIVLKTSDGLRMKGTFGLEIGGQTAEFAFSAEYNTRDEQVSADIRLADVQPALFASTAPLFESLAGIKLPLSGSLRMRAAFDGTVREVALDLTGGQGSIALPWESSDASVPVRAVRLRSSLTRDLTVAQIDELSLDLGGPRIAASGTVQGVSQGIVDGPFEAVAELSVDDLSIALLKRLWPERAVPNARRWVIDNIHEGAIPDGRISLSGAAGDDGLAGFDVTDMSGGFRFQGLALSYFDTMSPIRRGQGKATMRKDSLSFAVTSAEVQGLQVGPGQVDITGLDKKDQHLAIETVVRGAVRQILTLLDHRRLGYAKALGVKPAEVGGDAAARLQIRFPLIEALTFKQVEIAAAATLRGVTLPKAAFDLDLTQGDFELQLDGNGMDIAGTGVLGITPINLTWVENFAPRGFARQFKIQATVDDAGRRSMGLDFDEYLHGPVGVDAVMTQYPSKANTLVLNADVTPAALDISELVWRKDSGVAGKLKAELALLGDKPTTIRDFTLETEGFSAAGNASFAADGKTISAARLRRLAFGRSDVTADIAKRADGGIDLALTGKSFDAAPYLKSDKDKPAPDGKAAQEKLTPLGIALTLETLYLGNSGGLTNVSARLRRNTKHWRAITVDGQPAPDKFFNLTVAPEGANRRLSVRSDDAGSVFKVLDISDNILGGRMQLAGTFDDAKPEEPLYGKLEVESFRLVKAPVIAKLLSVALLTGVLDSLRGEGIGFDRLDAPFTFKNSVIETTNARAHGAALGITAEGWINLRTDTLGLRGTIVPAYAVNSILNNIPLIGTLLGGAGSGVFAATYRMTGSLDDPDISVNPLATLAPGFLRGLFGIFEGGVPQQPDALPDPSRDVPLPEPSQRD
jgi:hypothetical protein